MLPLLTFSQENIVPSKTFKSSFYLELLGQGLEYSLVYDRLYNIDKKIINSSSVGFAFSKSDNNKMYAFPISYNWLIGDKNNYLELGIGFTYMVNSNEVAIFQDTISKNNFIGSRNVQGSQMNWYTYLTPKLGYRYQQPHGGFLFRVTFTPAVAILNRIGPIVKSNYDKTSRFDWFSSTPVSQNPVHAWLGISVGFTPKYSSTNEADK